MTLDAAKITYTTFILRDVLSDHGKMLFQLKALIKCLRLLYMFYTFLFTMESIYS